MEPEVLVTGNLAFEKIISVGLPLVHHQLYKLLSLRLKVYSHTAQMPREPSTLNLQEC